VSAPGSIELDKSGKRTVNYRIEVVGSQNLDLRMSNSSKSHQDTQANNPLHIIIVVGSKED
jgi:hypothetical protein